jgi:carbonic anhydrase
MYCRHQDPDGWADLASSSCGGSHQSPINIQPHLSVKKAFSKFTFHNYGNIDKMDLINNGQTG